MIARAGDEFALDRFIGSPFYKTKTMMTSVPPKKWLYFCVKKITSVK